MPHIRQLKTVALEMAVKMMKDLSGPDGFPLVLLVYSTLRKISGVHAPERAQKSTNERLHAARTAQYAYVSIVNAERLRHLQTSRISTAHGKVYSIGDPEFVWREEEGTTCTNCTRFLSPDKHFVSNAVEPMVHGRNA